MTTLDEDLKPCIGVVANMVIGLRTALVGRSVRVTSNFVPVGVGEESWRGEVRKIVGVRVNDNGGIGWRVQLLLEGHEGCFIPADAVELV